MALAIGVRPPRLEATEAGSWLLGASEAEVAGVLGTQGRGTSHGGAGLYHEERSVHGAGSESEHTCRGAGWCTEPRAWAGWQELGLSLFPTAELLCSQHQARRLQSNPSHSGELVPNPAGEPPPSLAVQLKGTFSCCCFSGENALLGRWGGEEQAALCSPCSQGRSPGESSQRGGCFLDQGFSHAGWSMALVPKGVGWHELPSWLQGELASRPQQN